jgi:hypothetical protein
MTKTRTALLATAITAALSAGLAFEIVNTKPVRGALQTCSELFTVANRPDLIDSDRLAAASSLCTARYLKEHPLTLAPEGGLVNIPRNLNKNYKAWREGPNVLICTSNRVGPTYQFVYEGDRWRFDGLVGILRPWGELVRTAEFPQPASDVVK